MKNISRYVLGAVVVVLAVGVIAFIYVDNFFGQEAAENSEASPSPSSVSGVSTFTSHELGVSFKYLSEQDPGLPTKVTQVGDKVYVSVGDMSVESGQSLEVFTKPAEQSFADAIRDQILASFPSTDCTVEASPSNIQGGYWVAEIGYPMAADADVPFWENAKLCNEKYDKANGIRYFLYDPSHPTKFLFVDIGQYFIQGPNSIPWQHSITFID